MALKVSKLRAMLRIYNRISVADGAEKVLTQLDETFVTEHAMAHISGYDMVCAKTALPKNPGLEAALLTRTLERSGLRRPSETQKHCLGVVLDEELWIHGLLLEVFTETVAFKPTGRR